ncbi:MAG: tRNA lysidine(34) synthetase TilS [bacterium]|nr:tRNA lysidine(34) synthetase TilS [bacterium]
MFETARHILSRVAPEERILLAVSGGGDSFAMLKWFAAQENWRHRVVAAHVNHNLREDSKSVATLVSRQAASLIIPLLLAEVNVPGAIATRKESIEACARRLRYAALEEIRVAHDCTYIATAHTQGDDAETVLMKLTMNSSWYECTGIPVQRGNVLRPFVRVARVQLRGLISPEDKYDTDPMNEDLRFLRVQARTALEDGLQVVVLLSKHGTQLQKLQNLTSRLIKANNNIILGTVFRGSLVLRIYRKTCILKT